MSTLFAELPMHLLRATGFLGFSAIIAGAIIRFAKPCSPRVQQRIWFLVLIEGLLFFPISIALPWYEAQPLPIADQHVRGESPTVVATPSLLPAVSLPVKESEKTSLGQAAVSPSSKSSAIVTNPPPAAWNWHWPMIILLVWLTGILIVAILACMAFLQNFRIIAASLDPEESWAAQWMQLLSEHRIGRPIPLRVTVNFGPALCLSPSGYRLLVPKSLWTSLTDSQRRAILIHELAHWRRGDVWKLFLARLLVLPHWFNPLAWWAMRKFHECTEWICDDATVDSAPHGGLEYAQALLKIGSDFRPRALYGTAVHGGRLFHRIRRLVAMNSRNDPAIKKILLILPLIVLLFLGIFRVQLVAKDRAEAETPPPVSSGNGVAAEAKKTSTESDAKTSLAATAETAIETAADTRFPPPQSISASGKVVDASDKPVAGAKVYLRKLYQITVPWDKTSRDIVAETQTNEQGEFRLEYTPKKIEEIDLHLFGVLVIAPGKALSWQDMAGLQSRQEPPQKEPNKEFLFRLQPKTTITGRVTDEAGRPIEGAEVAVPLITNLNSELMDRSPDPGLLNFNFSRLAIRATADAEGRVTLSGLPGDKRLCLVITHPRYHYTWLLAATTDQPQPDIEGFDEESNGDLQKVLMPVHAGSFTAMLKPARRIVGTVVAADSGKPLEGIKVSAMTRPPTPYIDFLGPGVFYAVTDGAGKFVFTDAPKSSYKFTFTPPADSKYLGQTKTIATAADKSELAIRIDLARGNQIDGRVVDKETGKGIPAREVVYRLNDKNAQSNPLDIVSPIPAKTDSDGRFHLLVPPGKGTVILSEFVSGGGGSAYGFSGNSGPETQAELDRYSIHIIDPPVRNVELYAKYYQEVDVTAGQPAVEVIFSITPLKDPVKELKEGSQEGVLKIDVSEVGISFGVGETSGIGITRTRYPPPKVLPEIQGIALDAEGQPVADAVVGLRDWFRTEKIYARRFVHTDASGRFTLRAILLLPRQAIKAVQDQRQLVGVTPLPQNTQPGATQNPVEIRLSATGSVSGLLQKEGKPLSGVQVAFYQGPPDFVRTSDINSTDAMTTDDQGRFKFPLAPAGKELTFSVFAHNLFTEKPTRKVMLKAGETAELEPFVFLSTDESLTGTIVDPEGKPVESAYIQVWPKDNPRKRNELNSLQTAHVKPITTAKDGRFTITGLPNIPLTLEVSVVSEANLTELYKRKQVPIETGQKEVRIEIVPTK